MTKGCVSIPTPQAASNSLTLKFSEPVAVRNEKAASNWAGVLICRIVNVSE